MLLQCICEQFLKPPCELQKMAYPLGKFQAPLEGLITCNPIKINIHLPRPIAKLLLASIHVIYWASFLQMYCD